MSSISNYSRSIKQPYGGYLPLKSFEVFPRNDGVDLAPQENIPAGIVGVTVDYLTRYMLSQDPGASFDRSVIGSTIATRSGVEEASTEAYNCLKQIQGLDDLSIIHACRLAQYDVFLRNQLEAARYAKKGIPDPDEGTIHNIRTMVQRSFKVLKDHEPILGYGMDFGDGYSEAVDSGECDFVTADTIWDFKVLTGRLTSKHTVKLLMMYVMGKCSGLSVYDGVSKVAIFNPRSNTLYKKDLSDLPSDGIQRVKSEILQYPEEVQ